MPPITMVTNTLNVVPRSCDYLPSFFLKFKEREVTHEDFQLIHTTSRGDKDHGYKYYQLCRDKYFYYLTGSPVLSHLSKAKLPLRFDMCMDKDHGLHYGNLVPSHHAQSSFKIFEVTLWQRLA